METNFAKVKWSEEKSRYELHIGGVLKAYSKGDNEDEHLIGKHKIIQTCEAKGYEVHVIKK